MCDKTRTGAAKCEYYVVQLRRSTKEQGQRGTGENGMIPAAAMQIK